jgi:predicted secreted protein
MFDDKRSKKLVLIAHCVLNQNVKIDRCAHYPGVIKEVTRILIDSDVGLLQMPCPELFCLGIDRQVDQGADTTIESEDTRVAQRMREDPAIARCAGLVHDLVYQLAEYQKNGFELVGVVGINGSPTCGVETTWSNNQEEHGAGVFIEMLSEECRRRGISLPMRGLKAYESQQATAVIMDLLGSAVAEE